MRTSAEPEMDGALFRLPVDRPQWAEAVPPVPAGHRVTVTFSDADVEAEHGDALVLLGYRVLGVVPSAPANPQPGGYADLHVGEALLTSHRRWAGAVAALATRIWRLDHGPVRLVFASTIAVHGAGR